LTHRLERRPIYFPISTTTIVGETTQVLSSSWKIFSESFDTAEDERMGIDILADFSLGEPAEAC